MAILPVLEGGLPACRKATHSASPFPTASFPKTILQLLNPTRPKRPGRRWRISKLPPAAKEATDGCGRTKAGKTGGMVCEDFRPRSNNFSDA